MTGDQRTLVRFFEAQLGLLAAEAGETTLPMHLPARVRIARGTSRDALVAAATASNYTLRSLTERLRAEGFQATHALLSQARSGKRSICGRLAKRIEEHTGFKASRGNWPRMRDDA